MHKYLYEFSAYCGCTETIKQIPETLIEDNPLVTYAYCADLVWQEWKNEVDKKSMKNPGSEGETGVDSDAVWNAVIGAMTGSYYQGIINANTDESITREELEEMLRERLKEIDHSAGPDP